MNFYIELKFYLTFLQELKFQRYKLLTDYEFRLLEFCTLLSKKLIFAIELSTFSPFTFQILIFRC